MSEESKTVSTRIPVSTYKQILLLEGYTSVSDFVRDAIREKLEAAK